MLAQMRQAIRQYRMVEPGDLVVVACSGGADSSALLHALWQLRGELGIRLHVAHLDHRLRGRQSREDAVAVADLAVSLGLPVTVGTADVAELARRHRSSTQVAAREVRYAFLYHVASEVGARVIALGHNRGDQAETVVMRLLRGTGVEGLGGIPPVRPLPAVSAGLVIRPILFSPRREIEAYCRANGLSPREDASNKKTDYLRNRVRLEIMPALRRVNANLDRALVDLADQARQESAFLEAQALDLLARMREPGHDVVLSLRTLRLAPVALQRRALRQAMRAVLNGRVGGAPVGSPSFRQVESLRLLALSDDPSGHLDLAFGLVADREYDKLWLTRAPAGAAGTPPRMRRHPQAAAVPLRVPGRTDLPALGWSVVADVLPGVPDPSAMVPGEAYLDLDLLTAPLQVRNRRPGDRFRPLGSAGVRRLKDFLAEQKVPVRERDLVPLVVMDALLPAGGPIVWVGGLRPAEDFRLSPATRRVLHLRLVPFED